MAFERAIVVSYRVSIVTIALSLTFRPQFADECLRRSSQQGMRHFGSKFGKGLTDVICKRNRLDIFCHSSTIHERGRQTDYGPVISIVMSAMLPNNAET